VESEPQSGWKKRERLENGTKCAKEPEKKTPKKTRQNRSTKRRTRKDGKTTKLVEDQKCHPKGGLHIGSATWVPTKKKGGIGKVRTESACGQKILTPIKKLSHA